MEQKSIKDRLREITESIEQGIKDLFESEKYRQYLRTMSRFHRYSVNNTLLMLPALQDITNGGISLGVMYARAKRVSRSSHQHHIKRKSKK